jgi:hypothetical protein
LKIRNENKKNRSKKVAMFYVKESPFRSSKQKNCRGTKEIECTNNLIFFINVGFGKMP